MLQSIQDYNGDQKDTSEEVQEVSESDITELIKEITEEEVKEATFSMHPDK